MADNVRKSVTMPGGVRRMTGLKRQSTLSSMDASAAVHAERMVECGESHSTVELMSYTSDSSAPSSPATVKLGTSKGRIRVPKGASHFDDTQVLVRMPSADEEPASTRTSSRPTLSSISMPMRAMSTSERQMSGDI